MDPLHLVIAIGPLGVYLLLIGLVNLGRGPFVTTGGRDLAALAVGVSGLVVAGPMELFLPEGPARQFGGFVWLLLMALYSLGVTLLILLMRPRIVIYNVTAERLRPVLASVVEELDPKARWAGECLVLPQLGVQLHVESMASMRTAELVSAGPRQSFQGWRQLEVALARSLRDAPATRRGLYGVGLTVAGMAALLLVAYWVVNHHQTVAQSLRDMLRL